MTRIPRGLRLTLAAPTLAVASLPSRAAGDLSQPPPVEVKVQLGESARVVVE